MKKLKILLKIGLVGLFLTLSVNVFGQAIGPDPIPVITPPIATPSSLHVGTYDDGAGAVDLLADAVLFYNPAGTAITLSASANDGNGNDFDLYVWYVITNADGSAGTPHATTEEQQIIFDNLGPGYHRFRVYGIVESSTEERCNSEEFQDIVIFVLNPLDPSAAAISTITEFCIATTPTGSFTLNATVALGSPTYQNTDLPNPAAADFNVSYRYFAINSNDTNTEIELDTASPIGGGSNSLEVDYADLKVAGTYTFFVEVRYSEAIKTSTGIDHAVWQTQVETSTGTPFTIEVTPKPGRPTITIISTTD